MKHLDANTLSLALMLRAAGYKPTDAELRIGGAYADSISGAEGDRVDQLYDYVGMPERFDTQMRIGTRCFWGSYYYYYCVARAQKRLASV